jgi:hypothetical protein
MKLFYLAKRKLQLVPAAAFLVALAISIPLSAQTITTFDAPGAGTGPGQGTYALDIEPSGTTIGFIRDANEVRHGFIRSQDGSFSPQHLAAAKDAAETALRLEPNREEARLALARYYYHGLRDYRRTQQELSSLPSSAPLYPGFTGRTPFGAFCGIGSRWRKSG